MSENYSWHPSYLTLYLRIIHRGGEKRQQRVEIEKIPKRMCFAPKSYILAVGNGTKICFDRKEMVNFRNAC